MTVLDELHALVEKMNGNPEHIQSEKDRVFQINLETSGKHQIIFETGNVRVEKGTLHKPAVTLILTDSNFSKLLKDDLNTMVAFMSGGLKVEGSVGLALKLQEIVKNYQ